MQSLKDIRTKKKLRTTSYPFQCFHHDYAISTNDLQKIKAQLKLSSFWSISNINVQLCGKDNLLTTIPMLFLDPSLTSSIVSSKTMFMNGSNPRRIPLIDLPPFNFTTKKNNIISNLSNTDIKIRNLMFQNDNHHHSLARRLSINLKGKNKK